MPIVSTPVLGALLCATTLAGLETACAEGTFGGHVAATTDYVFRGVSQTRGSEAVQAGVDYQNLAGWFGGLWVSTIDYNPGPGPSTEWNLYAGRKWLLTPDWHAQLSAVHYAYPDSDLQTDYAYDELIASMSFRGRVIATVSWSPNTTRYSGYYGLAKRESAFGYEMLARWPLGARWTASASLGYYDLDELFGTGYLYGALGLSLTLERLQLDLDWFNTDSTATELFGDETTGDRWSLTASWRF